MAKYSGAKKYKANVVNLTSKNEYEAEQFASFFSDSYGYLDDEIIRYNASDYDTTSKNYEDFQASSSSWKKRADSAKRYVEQHKDLFGEDYQSYTDYIDAFSKELDSVGTNYKDLTSFFSSFSTKDEYDYWEKASKLDIQTELERSQEKDAKEKEKSQGNAPAVLIPEDHPNYNSVISALESEGVNSVIEESNEWTFDEAIRKKEKQQSEALLDYARDIQYGQKFSQLTEDQKKTLLSAPGYMITNENGEEEIASVSPDEWEWLQDPVNYDSILSDREADNIAREKRINQAILPPEMQLKNGDDSYLNYYDTLQSIKQTKEFTAENPFLANVGSVLSSPIKAVGAVSGAVQGIFGEVDPYSDAFRINHMINAVREETSKNMGGAGAFIYNTGMSILENGFNMLISGGNPAVIGVLMGSQVASDTIMDAKMRGLSDLQALSLGGIAGVAEALFEKFSLGNLKQLAQNGGAGIKNFVKNWLKQAGVEASEEFFTEISNILTDEIISGDLSAYNLAINEALKRGLSYEEAVSNANKGLAKQIGEAAAGGFISGGVFGLFGNAYNVAQNRAVGKELSSAKLIDSTIEQARQYENPSDELTARLKDFDSKKNPSASYAGAVYRAMARESYGNLNATVKKEINSFVSQQLSESGIEANDKLVSAVAKKIYGSEKLTRAETKLIESEGVSNVIEKISKNKKLKSTPFQTEAFLKADQTARDVEKLGVDAVIRNAARKKYNVTENAAEIESIDVKDNGDVYIKQNGNVVEAEKAGVNPDTALALHYGEAMSPAKKREYFAHYNDYVGEGKMSLDDYHNYFDLAYTYGQVAKGIANAQNELKGTLSDEDIFTIYKSGLETRRSSSEKLSEQSKELQKALGIQDRTPGRVDDSLIRHGKIRSAERRAMIGFANVLATTTGRNIKFFDSTSKLRKENFPNGYYDPKTNTIYLDVNAGMLQVMREDQSAILSTLSHELIHIFRSEDVNGFMKLKELVLDTLSEQEQKTVKTLIDAEVRKIQESDPKRFAGKSLEQQRDIASEELVARSCENMLAESRLMKEFIQQLESKESGLAQRFSNMLGKAIEKLKEIFEKIFKNQRSYSKEATQIAKARKDMVDRWNAIKEQYDALLERRADTQAKENTSEDRGVMRMSRDTNTSFVEDKYFARQIDKFNSLKEGGYVTVGTIVQGSPLNQIGIPDGTLYFDVSKIIKEMKLRNDVIPSTIMKQIPNVLNDPIVITEYFDKNGTPSANVYGKLYVGGSPVVVGVMVSKTQKGNLVSKIQTVHPKRNFKKEMTSDNILYISKNKKETKLWFQSLSAQMPLLGENKLGFIRMLSQLPESVKTQFDKLLDRNIGIEQAQKNTSQGEVMMQARNINGNKVVWVENNLLKESIGTPTHQFIADYIANHIGEVYTIIESGQKVYLGKDLPKEYTQSKYTKTILQSRPNILKTKNRVASNLGKMIEIATNRRWERAEHSENKDAKYGIYKYDTKFGFPVLDHNKNIIGANVYDATLVILNSSDGKKYLYDLVGIKKDIASSDWMSQKTSRAADYSASQKSNISTNSIPNSPESVKGNDSTGVMMQERSVAKRRKNTYNEFNTNAMQWANSSSRNQNDVKILYDPRRKQYYLIGVSQDSDMGFIELNSGTRLQMEKEMEEYAERIYVDSTPEAFNTWTKDAEIGNRNGSWDNEFSRHSSEERINGKVPYSAIQSGKETDGAGDLTGTETDSRGVSYQERSPQKYSYEALTSKPDMKVTVIDDTVNYQPNKQTRKDVVNAALKNASRVGKQNKDGSVLVPVKDTGLDILIGRNGLKHGLDRRMNQNVAVTLKAGEILKNSVCINELLPDKENVSNSYVLIGVAKNSHNEAYVVEFLVNRYTNELTSIDVLYSANTKKESVAHNAPEITENPLLATDSAISIADLLDYVNRYFPDVLPESVLRRYGHGFRPEGKLGNSALYQERVPYQRRTYWAPDMNESERRYVRSVATNEAYKTDNYLDGITKWLYYEKNDNSYFALYSTDDTLPEPTILYACKGEKAKHEQGYVIDYFSKENQYGKGNDPESRIVNGIFVANKNSSDIGFADRGESLGRGSDDRTSSTHSKNERKRPSKALRNCLENIEEIREHRESERINSDDSKIMYQDRTLYQSTRDILMSYAENSKNVKARSKYLDEYVERSNALDRKYRRLEDAESRLAEAISQGNEEKIALYTKRAKTKQREIHRLNEDLQALEESKELKAIVRREKEATKRQANAEQRAALHDYRDELERKARTERIMAKTKLLSKKLIANNRENHVPDALKEPLTRFLTALEYHSPRSKRGGDTTQKERSFSFLLDDVSDALRESSAYQSQNGKMVISEDVYDEIQALSKALRDAAPASDKYVLDEMTAAELQLLDRVMTKIVHGLNSIDRAFASSGRQEIDSEGKETMAFLDKMEDQKGSDYKNAAENEKKKLTWHGLAKFLTWEQFTPATAFNRLGEAGKRIYRRIVEGWGEYAYLAKKILKFSEENWKNNSKPFSKNTHEIRANGKIYAISDAQLMYLYLADQRKQGRNHLDGDGFIMPGNVDTAESDKIHMSAEARQELYDKYIPEGSEARELARKMQKFLSENCAAWGNEVTLALYGYTAFTDENYVPLITDISGKRISGNLPVTNELYRILNMGFTKSLDAKAKNALIAMDIFDVFAKHAADMAKYKALGKPVLDAVRFFGYKETEVDPISGKPHDRTLQSRIRQVYGEEAYKYFTKFLEDLNGENPKSAAGLLGKTSTWFLKNYKLAAIGFSFKTIVLQFTSYFRASYVLSGKSMTKAVTLLSRREKKLLDNDKTKKYSELAQQYSGMAAWKSLGYYDVNITRSLTEQIKGDATRTEKIAEKATAGMGKADEKTLGVLFKACCIEVIRTIDVTGLTQEDIYRKAGELLDEVIVKTQVVDSVVTRSKAMRGDDGLEKSLTSFMSEPTVSYNVLIDAVFDVTEKKKQGKPLLDAIKSQGRTIKKALISYAITSVAAAMVESAFDAWRDDEDEELWERWWNHLGGNVIENISVIGKLPFLRDGIAFLTTVGGGYANTDRMEYAAFTEITNVIKKGVKLWQDDYVTYHDVYGFIKSLTSAASYSTSIPLQNGLRKVEDLWNNTFGDWYDMKLTTQEPSFAKQYDSAFNRGRAKAQISELIGAKVKEYGKKYPEEKESAIRKKAESSLQSSLTRYYKPLYLKAWEDDDREEMDRIRNALCQSRLYEDLGKTLQNWV